MVDTTSPEADDALDVYRRKFAEPAAILYAVQKLRGDEVRVKTNEAYGQLVNAHLLITGVFAAGLLRLNGVVGPTSTTSEERSALFASYVIGMSAVENTLEEGRYLQASALLRQEMETVAQLKAVSAGIRRPEGSPNVNVLEQSLKRLYGDLTAAAHISKHHVVRSAVELTPTSDDPPPSTSAIRHFPEIDKGLARRSFGLHLLLTLHVIAEFSIDLRERLGPKAFTAEEIGALNFAILLMQKEGVVET